jgi:hypothetical protein
MNYISIVYYRALSFLTVLDLHNEVLWTLPAPMEGALFVTTVPALRETVVPSLSLPARVE